jgi:hypothetical protein
MSVEWTGTTVVVRKDSQSPAWGFIYLLAAVAVVWVFVANAELQAVLFAGLALGFCFAWAGVSWLLPGKEILRLDTSTRLIRATYGSIGARYIQQVTFAEVASVGTDTFKDPRNGAVWAVETVLRLKDGRRLAAGAPSDVGRIRDCTALLVEHNTILLEHPHVPVST